jgi:ribose 5-phosphate isomerase B
MVKVAIGSDHAGGQLRRHVKGWLETRGFGVIDCGVSNEESVDYPVFAGEVVRRIKEGEAAWGVLICGSGLGMSIAANRYEGIRAALCREEHSARMARRHNDANILVMGERFTGISLAEAILDAWLAASFEGGRHARRVSLVDDLPARSKKIS